MHHRRSNILLAALALLALGIPDAAGQVGLSHTAQTKRSLVPSGLRSADGGTTNVVIPPLIIKGGFGHRFHGFGFDTYYPRYSFSEPYSFGWSFNNRRRTFRFGFGGAFPDRTIYPYGYGTSYPFSSFPYSTYYDGLGSLYGLDASTYDGPPLLEVARRVDPQLVGVEPRDTLPKPEDPAAKALADGALNRAAMVYLTRTERQRTRERQAREAGDSIDADRRDLRMAALLLAVDRQAERAADHLAKALAEDASLRDEPLEVPTTIDASDLRRAMSSAAGFARKANSAAAWELTALIAQAQQEPRTVEAMLVRAANVGDQGTPREAEPTQPNPDAESPADPVNAPSDGADTDAKSAAPPEAD